MNLTFLNLIRDPFLNGTMLWFALTGAAKTLNIEEAEAQEMVANFMATFQEHRSKSIFAGFMDDGPHLEGGK